MGYANAPAILSIVPSLHRLTPVQVAALVEAGDFVITFISAGLDKGEFKRSQSVAFWLGDTIFLPAGLAFQARCLQDYRGGPKWHTSSLWQAAVVGIGAIFLAAVTIQAKPKVGGIRHWRFFELYHAAVYIPLFYNAVGFFFTALQAESTANKFKVGMLLAYLSFLATAAVDQIRWAQGKMQPDTY